MLVVSVWLTTKKGSSYLGVKSDDFDVSEMVSTELR